MRVTVKALGLHRWGTVSRVESSRLDNVQVADSVVRITVNVTNGIPSEALGLPAEVTKHPLPVSLLMQTLGM